MKYVSLIELMRWYGECMGNGSGVLPFSYSGVERAFKVESNYRPYSITPSVNEETGQVMNSLAQYRYRIDTQRGWRNETVNAIGSSIPNIFTLPPILEIEWLEHEFTAGEERADVLDDIGSKMDILTQIGYALIGFFAEWRTAYSNVDMGVTDPVMSYFDSCGVTMEVDEIEDVPAILNTKMTQFPVKRNMKIHSWQTLFMYGNNFEQVFYKCVGQTAANKELYLHMPILLAMFMCEHKETKLNGWSKGTCLHTEQKLQDQLAVLDNCMPNDHHQVDDLYTYGLASGISTADIAFIRWGLTEVYKKLHMMNENIGTVSISEYSRVRGPEMTNASIRLTNMDINWDKEMERAEKEKAEKEQAETEKDGNEIFENVKLYVKN